MTPEEYLSGRLGAVSVFAAVHDLVEGMGGGVKVQTTKSQIAFWRRRSFAYLWLPGLPAGVGSRRRAVGRPGPAR